MGGNKIGGIERLATRVALITSGRGGAALGAGALYVAIGKEALTAGAISLGHGGFIDKIPLEEGEKDVVSHPGVVRGAGAGEEVEGDPQPLPGFEELLMMTAGYLLG